MLQIFIRGWNTSAINEEKIQTRLIMIDIFLKYKDVKQTAKEQQEFLNDTS